MHGLPPYSAQPVMNVRLPFVAVRILTVSDETADIRSRGRDRPHHPVTVQQAVERHAQRVDITSGRLDGPASRECLGRQVLCVAKRRGTGTIASLACQPEIGDLDPAALSYQQVCRLQVTVKDSPGMQRLHAPAGFLHNMQGICHGHRVTGVTVGDASGRQVLHPDNRDSCLGVGGEDTDHVVVLAVEHHPRLGEHRASWQASGIQVHGCAETIQPEVLLQPDFAEKAAPQAAQGLVRHGYPGSNATADTTGSLRLAPTPSKTGMADKADVSSSLLRTP